MNQRRTSVIGWIPLWLAGAAQAGAPPQVPPAVGPVVPPAAPAVAAALPPLGPLTDDEFRLPLSDEDAANVDRWVPLLGSPDYKQRESATTALIEIGAPAFAKLRTAYEQADDLEARLRIEQVVRTAYLNRYVFDRNGFLGVQLDSFDPRELKGIRVPGIEGGVKLRQVLSDTAAAKAGLKAQDIIIAMNGAPLTVMGVEATGWFSESIRRNPPGTRIRFSVLRDGNTMTIEAVIGRCAENNVRNVRFARDYEQVSERFGTWWFKYFRNSPKPDTADEP